MTCSGDWEPRQPQDFVRGVADLMKTPWSRAEGGNNFILPNILEGLTKLLCTSTATIDIVVSPTTGKQLNGKPLNTNTLG
jgi:hypothetical protein